MQHKFAMNKALEQKLIGPMEESHTKQQSPKAVLWMELWARRSKIAAKWAKTRAWAGWGFFGRKMECVGAGISEGGHRGPTRQGVRPGGVGAPSTLVARCLPLLLCSQCQIFSNILEKIIFHFQGIWRTFIFGVFLYSTDKSKNRQKNTIFTLFQLNNRKEKEGTKGCAF